jgi:predicted nuclease of predicted toxin-antitoxin system
MRLVLDQGVPRDAAVGLRDYGYECVHVGEVGMHNAADDEILAWSGTDAVVVTLDADFHAILAVSGASGPSVIRFRIEGLRAPKVTSLIKKLIAEFRTDLEGGCLITVKSHKTTCHRLPIGGD